MAIYTLFLTQPLTAPLLFRDWQSVGANNTAEFTISNTIATTEIWDITNPFQPDKINSNFVSTQTKFINDATRLREYISFNNISLLIPISFGKIDNQNLHNSSTIDYLIITNPLFLAEAKRLALFHTQQNNFKVFVATTSQIFNEFASGNPDPSTLRDFVKMYYDKAGTDTIKRPKYLLLFGSASFDYKNRISGNTNMVPCYENRNALDPLATYTSDDFFGFKNLNF